MKYAIVVLSLAALPVWAQNDPADYESVLVPLRLHAAQQPTPGANGSEWATDLWIRNDSSGDVLFNQFGPLCRVPECGTPHLEPKETVDGEMLAQNGPFEGMLFHVERAHADDVHLSQHVRDISRASTDAGADVPVVRERDFLHGVTSVVEVPISGDFRVMLRAYGTTGRPTAVIVRAYDGASLLWEHSLALREVGAASLFPGYPSYGSLANLESQTVTVPRVRVEVTPVSDDPFWFFISVTHNDTQRVTLYTP